MDQAAAKIASLFDDGKFDEIAAQYQASAPTEETCAGLYVLAAQYLSALPLSREGLEKMWQQMKQLLQQAGPQISLALASAVQDTAARCTAAFYRACNDRLKLEYALLQKDVCFEKKEYVIRRMQELLLQADVDFSAALGMPQSWSHGRMACPRHRSSFSLPRCGCCKMPHKSQRTTVCSTATRRIGWHGWRAVCRSIPAWRRHWKNERRCWS